MDGFKVIWSEAAIADLDDICSYIAQQDPQAAHRIGRGILEHVRILGSFPFIGPTYPRGSRGPLREIVFRSYLIFYDVSEQSRSVEIHARLAWSARGTHNVSGLTVVFDQTASARTVRACSVPRPRPSRDTAAVDHLKQL